MRLFTPWSARSQLQMDCHPARLISPVASQNKLCSSICRPIPSHPGSIQPRQILVERNDTRHSARGAGGICFEMEMGFWFTGRNNVEDFILVDIGADDQLIKYIQGQQCVYRNTIQGQQGIIFDISQWATRLNHGWVKAASFPLMAKCIKWQPPYGIVVWCIQTSSNQPVFIRASSKDKSPHPVYHLATRKMFSLEHTTEVKIPLENDPLTAVGA